MLLEKLRFGGYFTVVAGMVAFSYWVGWTAGVNKANEDHAAEFRAEETFNRGWEEDKRRVATRPWLVDEGESVEPLSGD